ncbi:c-type cytochrome [Rhodoferax sp.]|uniref:c-type cytochrome n=1 Tax=Rhodoferax sp. TaxID=50421 RepID=UPI0025D006B3|nr:c-type cytochrome [Rhodoferax sp.]MCM2297405.1 c-type cytochrome [Rhodoferax sp.]
MQVRDHWLVVASLAVLTLGVSNTMAEERTGRAVVEQTCAACHTSGKDGAPKIGDVAAWTQHTKKGLAKLTESAIAGIGKMPAHAGQPDLSDLELSRAIAFMVSFGKAVDPKKPYASPTSMTGEQLVQSHCVNCHGDGKEGAPRIDDFNAWKPRLQKGMNGLVRSAISGHKAMPARSGMAQLSDTDLRNAVTYMVVQSATYKPGN